MRIVIVGADLDFLDGGDLVTARFPIRVMRAASQRIDLLHAIPRYDQMLRWKAFRYQATGPAAGSIAVVDAWRMDVRRATGNEEPDQIAILRIRNDQ